MITKTSIAAVVAVLIGSASAALANDQFDVNIYRPTIQGKAVDAFGSHRRPCTGARTSAPGR